MGYSLGISSWQTTNEAGNQSTVYCTLTLYSGGNSYSGYNTSWGMSIGGAGFGDAGPTSLSNGGSWSTTQSYTFTHDANGYRGAVNCYVSFNGSGGWSPPYMEAGPSSQGAIDYDRKPAAPSSVTTTVNSDKSITVTSNAVSSPAGTATYYISWSSSSDNSSWGSWSSYTTIGSNARAYTYAAGSLTPGQYYRFRMYASNSDGSSAAFSQTSGAFLPAGAKRFDGSSWATGSITKRFDGSSWVSCTTAKRFNGTDWINLS